MLELFQTSETTFPEVVKAAKRCHGIKRYSHVPGGTFPEHIVFFDNNWSYDTGTTFIDSDLAMKYVKQMNIIDYLYADADIEAAEEEELKLYAIEEAAEAQVTAFYQLSKMM